jgi:hypothetical protein
LKVSGQLHALSALPPKGRSPRHLMERRQDGINNANKEGNSVHQKNLSISKINIFKLFLHKIK